MLVQHYRLYFMDRFSGHILRFADFEAPDDDAAAALAGEYVAENPLELWSGHRKVRRLEPLTATRAPAAQLR